MAGNVGREAVTAYWQPISDKHGRSSARNRINEAFIHEESLLSFLYDESRFYTNGNISPAYVAGCGRKNSPESQYFLVQLLLLIRP